MSQLVPPPMPRMVEAIRVVAAQYEKKFAWEVISHHRNQERDMLVALARSDASAAFVRVPLAYDRA